MSHATQARPYALAAYDVAEKNNRVDEWWQALQALNAALASDKLRSFVKNPTVELNEKLDTLSAVCKEWMTEEFTRFVKMLGQNGRLLIIDDICTIFLKKKEEATQKVRSSFITAFELDADQQKALVNAISQKTGFNMSPEFSVDPDIIGGAIVRFNGNVIDLSVQKQLAQLKQNLIR